MRCIVRLLISNIFQTGLATHDGGRLLPHVGILDAEGMLGMRLDLHIYPSVETTYWGFLIN